MKQERKRFGVVVLLRSEEPVDLWLFVRTDHFESDVIDTCLVQARNQFLQKKQILLGAMHAFP